MSSEPTSPSAEESPGAGALANARRSGRLAATLGFRPGVCPYTAGSALGQAWVQAYTDALPAEGGAAGRAGDGR
ncbi:hypothetical protein GCM10017673_37750 [Streptosporangium violaceochromogenes]|nr:hypothetical protein GCM10017673_37750 [Streptosporangium violaceochromogenes]